MLSMEELTFLPVHLKTGIACRKILELTFLVVHVFRPQIERAWVLNTPYFSWVLNTPYLPPRPLPTVSDQILSLPLKLKYLF